MSIKLWSYNDRMLLCCLFILPVVETDPLYHYFISTSMSVCGMEHCSPVVTDIDVLSHADDNESTIDALDPSLPLPLVIRVLLIPL